MRKNIVLVIFLFTFILTACQNSEIEETKAIELSKLYIEALEAEAFIKTITNYDAPTVEKLDFEQSYYVFCFEERNAEPQRNDLKGRQVWKIVYTTTFDNFLGPHTIYLDRYSGKIYGSD